MSDESLDGMDGYNREFLLEDSDGFGLRLYLRRNVRDRGAPLTEEVQSRIFAACAKIVNEVQEEWARTDPGVMDRAKSELASFQDLFKEAGLTPVLVEPIANDYWPQVGKYAALRFAHPWAIVTSEVGRVKIGNRTRVLSIDWSDSIVKADAPTLFPKHESSKGRAFEHWIHAWSRDEATEILKTLGAARG